MTFFSRNSTPANKTSPPDKMLTQGMLLAALTDMIKHCHNGRVRKGCGAWYRRVGILRHAGYRGQSLDQAMYDWCQSKLAETRSTSDKVH